MDQEEITFNRPRKLRRLHNDGVGDGVGDGDGEDDGDGDREAVWRTSDGDAAASNALTEQFQFPLNGDNPTSESRSCESCRRSKLKCSRSRPCSKCMVKAIPCVYEHSDKKRGPRPGYIEELYRRINSLEHVVLGQSMMMNREGRSPQTMTFHEAVENEREHLEQLADTYRQQQPPTRPSFHPQKGSEGKEGQDHHELWPSKAQFQQLCHVYRHQIQPWLPIIRQEVLNTQLATAEPVHSLLKAIAAAVSPYVAATAADHQRYFSWLQDFGSRNILQSVDLDQIRITLIQQFLLFGKNHITDYWGLITYPPQVALRAGLHLEDHHLTTEHREFRRLVKLDHIDQSWVGGESQRRLFWTLFLQDQFAAIFSGTRPSFDAAKIRRLLPCEGQRWQDDQPVQTREFVQASVAVQIQMFPESNIGGFAYLIEATEILTMISGFASQAKDISVLNQDARSFLQNFLNLDLVLTSWKAKLPPRYHRASYDENGYMDHNITLAHMTHNTSGILLYQSPRAACQLDPTGNHLRSSLMPQARLVKQAAKEIEKICTRFLLHRRYLVSPQFIFCQFIAARALLAYSSWMMEPLDDDFETLHNSLAESAKRWDGIRSSHERNDDVSALDNLASKLYMRLTTDMRNTDAIDLTTPCVFLLRESCKGSPAPGSVSAGVSAPMPPPLPINSFQREADKSSQETTSGSATVTPSLSLHPLFGEVDEFDRAMAVLNSTEPAGLDIRIFSWHDSPEFGAPQRELPLELAASIQ